MRYVSIAFATTYCAQLRYTRQAQAQSRAVVPIASGCSAILPTMAGRGGRKRKGASPDNADKSSVAPKGRSMGKGKEKHGIG